MRHLLIIVVTTAYLLAFGSATAEVSIDRAARIVAQALAEAVIARDPDAAAVLCALPTNLDGETAETADSLLERWRLTLDRDDLRGVTLESLEVVTLEAATERYGQPPRRLGELDPGAVVAIIRFSRAQLVAVLSQRDGRWAVVAVTD